jgi:hypothetical protein
VAGPVRYARCDATSMVSRVDGDWTEEFAAACAELSKFLPSAPEDQRTNNVERSWQTLSHRMCAMMLNQDNLAKNMGSPSCLRRAPTTMQCATVTLRLHPRAHVWMEARQNTTQSFTQVSWPCATGHRKVLKAHFELCVTVCPCHMPT